MTRVFLFSIILLTSCSRNESINESNCSQVRNGEFYILKDGQPELTVSRKGDVQIERLNDGSVSRFRVHWLDSCRYRLTYISGSAVNSEKALQPVLVQIVEVKDSSYVVEGRVEGTAFGTAKLELFKTKTANPRSSVSN